MPHHPRRFAVAAFAWLVLAPVARAGDAAPGDAPEPPAPAAALEFDATAASRYLFQGEDLSHGPVLQPNLVGTLGGWSLTWWGSFQPGISEFGEHDLTLRYGRTLGALSLAAGAAAVTYPLEPGAATTELLLEASLDRPLAPTLAVHADLDEGRGAYAQFGVTQPVARHLALGTNVYGQSHYYGRSGISALELRAAGDVTVGPLALAPALSYFATVPNGGFRGDALLPRTWLFAVGLAPAKP